MLKYIFILKITTAINSQLQKLDQIFSNVEYNKQFLQQLKDQIPNDYKYVTTAISNSRVNIISEHTDYHYFPVLPCALEKYFAFAIAVKENTSESKIIVQHLNQQKCKSDNWNSQDDINSIAKKNYQWSQYVRAGFYSACKCDEELQQQLKNKEILLIGNGNVPVASGLSSSSALTCCSALAFSAFSQKVVDKIKLADLCGEGESKVAIAGGKMDQTISLNGKKGKACFVNFNPLTVDYYDMPEQVKIAVFSSLKEAKKASSNPNEQSFYNLRVAEGRVGNAILVQQYFQRENKDFKFAQQDKVFVGRDVMQLYKFKTPSGLLQPVDELPEKIQIFEASQLLGYQSVEQMKQKLLSTPDGSCLIVESIEELTIRKRLLHVYSEGFRCYEFVRFLQDKELAPEQKIAQLGELINQSHESCKNDYQCSCAELDEVVEIARQNGAICARMTGAGFGGYCVALIMKSTSEEWLQKMKQFYKGKGIKEEQMNDIVFLTEPCQGGSYIDY